MLKMSLPETYSHIDDTESDLETQGARTTYRTQAEILSAIARSESAVINEYIKAEYVNKHDSNLSYVGEKEYKILDENATNQEIIDNYDIESAVITSIPDVNSREIVTPSVLRNITLGNEIDSGIDKAIVNPSHGVV